MDKIEVAGTLVGLAVERTGFSGIIQTVHIYKIDESKVEGLPSYVWATSPGHLGRGWNVGEGGFEEIKTHPSLNAEWETFRVPTSGATGRTRLRRGTWQFIEPKEVLTSRIEFWTKSHYEKYMYGFVRAGGADLTRPHKGIPIPSGKATLEKSDLPEIKEESTEWVLQSIRGNEHPQINGLSLVTDENLIDAWSNLTQVNPSKSMNLFWKSDLETEINRRSLQMPSDQGKHEVHLVLQRPLNVHGLYGYIVFREAGDFVTKKVFVRKDMRSTEAEIERYNSMSFEEALEAVKTDVNFVGPFDFKAEFEIRDDAVAKIMKNL